MVEMPRHIIQYFHTGMDYSLIWTYTVYNLVLLRLEAFMKELENQLVYSYAAGIINGEGSILLSHSNNTTFRNPVVSVSSTSYELLLWLKSNFGGHICTHKVYKFHHKPNWSWRLASDSSISFLKLILPYMKEKSKCRRAKLICLFYKKLTKRNGKYTLIERKAKLKFERIFLSS